MKIGSRRLRMNRLRAGTWEDSTYRATSNGEKLGREVAERVIAAIEEDGRPNQLAFGRDIPWEQPLADETVRLGVRFTRTAGKYNDDITWRAPQPKVGVVYGDALPWNQRLPVDPSAGEWKPLFLTRSKVNELAAVPPPPANNYPETKRDIEEIITAVNNRTCYTDFIVFKNGSTSLATGRSKFSTC